MSGLSVVIKLGGELLGPQRAEELAAITAGIKGLVDEGHRVVLVHGGGPQTSALQRQLGQEPKMVGGRRVTDDAALDTMIMVVAGRMNVALVSALRGVGLSAVGLNGVSAHLIACEKRPAKVVSGGGPDPVDFGHVGDVTGVNRDFLELLLSHQHIPVLACLGSDGAGRPFNINADTVANGVAVALAADRLLLITSTPGVLRDIKDPASRISTLTVAQGHAAITDGTVQGGMIPKLEESFEALSQGVGQIHILGHIGPGDLHRALAEPGAVGTALLP